MIIGKLAFEHLAVERRISVDDRLLAAISFHRLEHDLGDGGFARDAVRARLGVAVPLHVKYRRKSVVVFRHVQYEPHETLFDSTISNHCHCVCWSTHSADGPNGRGTPLIRYSLSRVVG